LIIVQVGKMDIGFEIDKKNKKEVLIKDNDRVMGRIFTPAGTSENITNAIQVCGFDDLFSYWSCGVYGDGNGNPKKDIQILFNKNSQSEDIKLEMTPDWCGRCFYLEKDCRCKDLRLKDIKEVIVDNLENE